MSKKEIINDLYKKITKNIKKMEYKEAIENYIKILELTPSDVNKYLKELGELYEREYMFYKAVECYVKVLHNEKRDLSTIGVLTNQIGNCYFNLKHYKLAIHYFKKVLLIKEIPDVYTNIGLCYINMKNYKEAEVNFLESYKLDSTSLRTTSSLGEIYYNTKQYKKSIEFYEKNSKKDDYVHLYNKSFSYLSNKDFKKGFELYENRLKLNNINKQTNLKDRLDVPLDYWNGSVPCNRLLIVSEQGLGDNIQYYRFIIELSEKYPNMYITFFCKQELSHIFKTYNNIEIIKNLFVFSYDYKLYLMSLPKILNLTTIIPNKINYINVSEDKLILWKEKTRYLKKMKVGFVYNGLLSSYIEKNISLKEFEMLCDLEIDLICIHKKTELETDLNNLNFKDKIHHFDIDVETPFEDTIHLLQNLDLLITVDTFIVHLAGILNIKTWLLLGVSEWRWSDDSDKTYWYDSVELIRTAKDEKLIDLLKTVKNKLINITASNDNILEMSNNDNNILST
jgi:tetratricopeptide (TPR) repeat protein